MKTRDLLLIIMGSLVGAVIAGFIIYGYRKKIVKIAWDGYEWVTGEREERERKQLKENINNLTLLIKKCKEDLDKNHKEQMMRLDQLGDEAKDLIAQTENLLKENAEMFPDLPRTDEERAQSAKKHEKEMEEIGRQRRCIDAFIAATRANIEFVRADTQETQVISHLVNPANILTYTPQQISENFENANAKVEQAKGKCEKAENEFYRLSNEIDGKQNGKIVLRDDGGSQKQSQLNGGVSK